MIHRHENSNKVVGGFIEFLPFFYFFFPFILDFFIMHYYINPPSQRYPLYTLFLRLRGANWHESWFSGVLNDASKSLMLRKECNNTVQSNYYKFPSYPKRSEF
jgi:hypothetical protein